MDADTAKINHSIDTEPPGRESRHVLKGISAKLISAVLVAVILPFFGLVYFIDSQIETRLKENIVRQSLLSLAEDIASEIDNTIRDCNADVALLASGVSGDVAGDLRMFDRYIQLKQVYDLFILVSPEGRLITSSSIKPDGSPMEHETIQHLTGLDYRKQRWFRRALKGEITRVDNHQSSLLRFSSHTDAGKESRYHIGFAMPVYQTRGISINKPRGRANLGVMYALVNWRHIQALIDVPEIRAYFSGLVKDKEPSPYAWIWGADANTILAHKNRGLYHLKVNGPEINLPAMVEDASSAHFGHYREYSWQGNEKNAAFFHTKGPEAGELHGGFGWVVGVGIDNDDIYAMSGQLIRLLYKTTAVVIVLVILWTLAVARRTTRPILTLQKHMRRVSSGNLEEHIDIHTNDEISDLAEDFNRMLQELKEKRARLIKAEKNAAWREMAQQISHDIKNTLTPINLSIDLLKQSASDDSPQYQQILKQTLELIDNQMANLQEIATNFYEYTGGRKPKFTDCDLGLVMAEVVQLNHAWAGELNIKIKGLHHLMEDTRAKFIVRADAMKLHRVLNNLVSNAFHAMPEGGTLEVILRREDTHVALEIRDTGDGIPIDVREHLFEPYFTTRSKGTGLGLAIARRVVEEIHGTITLEPNHADGIGTVARIRLPLFVN